MYQGNGYCVGPNYEVEGPMVFEIHDKHEYFTIMVREDKPFAMDGETRRRENSITLSTEQLKDLFSSWLAKRLGQ